MVITSQYDATPQSEYFFFFFLRCIIDNLLQVGGSIGINFSGGMQPTPLTDTPAGTPLV